MHSVDSIPSVFAFLDAFYFGLFSRKLFGLGLSNVRLSWLVLEHDTLFFSQLLSLTPPRRSMLTFSFPIKSAALCMSPWDIPPADCWGFYLTGFSSDKSILTSYLTSSNRPFKVRLHLIILWKEYDTLQPLFDHTSQKGTVSPLFWDSLCLCTPAVHFW